MRFRNHRGGLTESIETTREIADRADLVAFARAELSRWGFDFDDAALKSHPYGGDDDRCGWKNVHIVTIDGYGVFGFCEGEPK